MGKLNFNNTLSPLSADLENPISAVCRLTMRMDNRQTQAAALHFAGSFHAAVKTLGDALKIVICNARAAIFNCQPQLILYIL